MHYIIDGYNLMFRVLRAGDDLQMQRQSIIRDLSKKIQTTGIHATLVFDAQYQKDEATYSHFHHLEIHFTSKGETADDHILSQFRHIKNPRNYTVVTSDKKLAWLARRQGALTETVEEFLKMLNSRVKNKLKRLKLTPPKEIIPPTKPAKTPQLPIDSSSLEDCFEYYLENFEKNFQELIQPILKKKEKKVSRKKKNLSISKQEDSAISNWERWITAFERELEDHEKQF